MIHNLVRANKEEYSAQMCLTPVGWAAQAEHWQAWDWVSRHLLRLDQALSCFNPKHAQRTT
jgi:hypothetical protein